MFGGFYCNIRMGRVYTVIFGGFYCDIRIHLEGYVVISVYMCGGFIVIPYVWGLPEKPLPVSWEA
jgi:hypothetical protein